MAIKQMSLWSFQRISNTLLLHCDAVHGANNTLSLSRWLAFITFDFSMLHEHRSVPAILLAPSSAQLSTPYITDQLSETSFNSWPAPAWLFSHYHKTQHWHSPARLHCTCMCGHSALYVITDQHCQAQYRLQLDLSQGRPLSDSSWARSLIPELNKSVPTSRRHFRRFVRMPQSADADGVMCLELVVQLLRLPVPNEQLPICIAGYQVTAATSASAVNDNMPIHWWPTNSRLTTDYEHSTTTPGKKNRWI